ncbi:hypothetical protein ACFC63_26805 [Streptomyces albidoflavus]
MDLSFYKSPISQEIRAEGEARALLLVLRGRGFDVPSETEQAISACRDRAALERWLSRAGTAANLDEVFADD